MTVFHQEQLKIFVRNLLRALAVLFALQLLLFLPDLMEHLLGFNSPLLNDFIIILQFVLALLDFILPLALLLATLFTMGSSARNYELMALSSAGWSLFQTTWPLLLVGVLAMGFSSLLRILGLSMPPDLIISLGSGSASHSISNDLTAAENSILIADHALPLVNVLSVMTGIVLASKPGHRSVYGQGGRALFILLSYFLITKTMVVLGGYQVLPPIVAGWSGVVFYGIAITAMWKRAIS